MKKSTFTIEALDKKTPIKKRSIAPKATVEKLPKMSPWAREVMKRIEKLHDALDGQKLA